jgi:DNA-binding transcriptional LysR family regulator
MVPAIGHFAKKNPQVEIDFQLGQVHEFSRVLSERIDISVGAMLPVTITTVLPTPLFDLPIVAVMPKDHTLAKRSFVRPADIAQHKLIAPPVGPLREELEHAFHSEGVEFHPQYIVNNVELACQMVLQTGGITITDPLVPLSINPKLFALVRLRPERVMQTSIFTPVLMPESRSAAAFKACLHETAQSIEKQVASLLGRSHVSDKSAVRRRPEKRAKQEKKKARR